MPSNISNLTRNAKELALRARAGIRETYSNETVLNSAIHDWQNSKYEVLSGDKHTITIGDTTYQRIRALRRIERPFGLPPIEPGDLGGYIATNPSHGITLSHRGSCWVADDALISGYVSADSQVTGHAHVGYPSKVNGQSLISDFAQVIDGAEVTDSMVTDYAQVVGRNFVGLDKDLIFDRRQTTIDNYSWVSGRARVSDGALVSRFSRVSGSAVVAGHIQLRKGAIVTGGVMLVSERGFTDLSGEVIDEPMNMWGFPTALLLRANDDWVHSAEAFGREEYGSVLPYWKDSYPRVHEAAQEIADIYGVKIDVTDAGPGAYASSFDKEEGYPRNVQTSPVTGIEYLQRPDKDEYEEFMDHLAMRQEALWDKKWLERAKEEDKHTVDTADDADTPAIVPPPTPAKADEEPSDTEVSAPATEVEDA